MQHLCKCRAIPLEAEDRRRSLVWSFAYKALILLLFRPSLLWACVSIFTINNMFSPRPKHSATAEYHELQEPLSMIGDDLEADSRSQERGEMPHEDKQETLPH